MTVASWCHKLGERHGTDPSLVSSEGAGPRCRDSAISGRQASGPQRPAILQLELLGRWYFAVAFLTKQRPCWHL